MKSIYPFWVDSNFENERGLYWNLVNQNPCRSNLTMFKNCESEPLTTYLQS
jgi:hypothetical protein